MPSSTCRCSASRCRRRPRPIARRPTRTGCSWPTARTRTTSATRGRSAAPTTLLVGERDELFRAEAYAPLLEPVQPRLKVQMLPGLGHLDMVIDEAAVAAIVKAA
jgi:pimeloyl-ACP methyl ester carboxylesterase